MRLSREQYLLNRRRIRKVMEYLAVHLDDDRVRLDTLADVANLSRFHFERLYAEKVGESPIATVRRLRLMRARHMLQQGSVRSITDLAVQSGYGSVAAFSRAFTRAFAQSPTQVSGGVQTISDPLLEIMDMPALSVVRQPFSGRAGDVFEAGHDINWAVARSGARTWRHCAVHPDGWVDPVRNPDSWVRVWHCIPSATVPDNVPGVDRVQLPAGPYARFSIVGNAPVDTAALIARIADETAWKISDGFMMRHYPNVHDYTPVPERITHFYMAVARQ